MCGMTDGIKKKKKDANIYHVFYVTALVMKISNFTKVIIRIIKQALIIIFIVIKAISRLIF
jgi:hypothetical protein